MSDVIRTCRPDDADALAAIYDPIVAATAISFEEIPPGGQEMRRRIERAAGTYPWLVYERADGVAGYVYASAHRERAAYRWSVDVSAYVASNARRQGIASRLYLELFALLSAQGYATAFAGVALPNPASCKLHEAVGFTAVGTYHAVGYKADSWHDVRWFERRLRTFSGPPSEPLPLPAGEARILRRF